MAQKTVDVGKVSVQTAAIIGAIWVGLFGFSFAVQFLAPDQLFVLILVAMALGAVLTIAVLWWILAIVGRAQKGQITLVRAR